VKLTRFDAELGGEIAMLRNTGLTRQVTVPFSAALLADMAHTSPR
jgi:hypothetical protein